MALLYTNTIQYIILIVYDNHTAKKVVQWHLKYASESTILSCIGGEFHAYGTLENNVSFQFPQGLDYGDI